MSETTFAFIGVTKEEGRDTPCPYCGDLYSLHRFEFVHRENLTRTVSITCPPARRPPHRTDELRFA